MTFLLKIETDSAAFHSDDETETSGVTKGHELASILRKLADRLDDGDTMYSRMTGNVRDTNGNTVGNWTLT